MTFDPLKILIASIVPLALAAGAASCASSDLPEEEEERSIVLEMDQEVVVPTSRVRVVLRGTDRIEADLAELSLEGEIGGRDVSESFEVELQREGDVGDLYAELAAEETLWPRLKPGDEGRFRGELEVRLDDALGVVSRGHLERVSWRFVRELAPVFEFEAPEQLFPNANIELEGSGVLRPEEGRTVAVIDEGHLDTEESHTVELTGEVLPVEWTGQREEGRLRLDPAVVGVHPGALEATIHFENRYVDDTVHESPRPAEELLAPVDRTFIANATPTEASRGQLVDLEGRGFVPRSSEDGYGMHLRFEGTLTPADSDEEPQNYEGSSALERPPFEVVSDELLRQDVWYRVVERELEGLGAMPGVFEGSITPIVFDEYGELEGIAWNGTLEVLPTRQMVYLKYLPSFSVALDRYGLANVERPIRERIVEVVERDYDGINIDFVEQPPERFADYATVELGGPDPTGNYAFGFDNTFHDQPKDTGNLHLDSYLGGINPETGEVFNNPYGGVFVESFARFSPTLHPEMSHTSDLFDRVFEPFMPELGGERVRATEWPDGDRVDEIEEAIRVFSNVVGNTVSHEIGHAMGLAHFEEDWDEPGHRFHNTDPGGFIMDAGEERSFEQRAQIAGQGPETFNETNRKYLEVILPLE